MDNYREYLKSILADILTAAGFTVSLTFPPTVNSLPWAFVRVIGEHDSGERDDSNDAKVWEAAFWVYVGFGITTTVPGALDTELSRVQNIIKFAFENADDSDWSMDFAPSTDGLYSGYEITVTLCELLQLIPGENDTQSEGELQLIGRMCFTQEFVND